MIEEKLSNGWIRLALYAFILFIAFKISGWVVVPVAIIFFFFGVLEHIANPEPGKVKGKGET